MAKRQLHILRSDFNAISRDRNAKKAVSTHFSATSSVLGVGYAVVVSKKVAKSSVSRHLMKRRVREATRPFCDDSRAIIIYARAGAGTLPYAAIIEELSPLLQRIVS
jgi:ribonuclease P protein component